MVHDDQEKPVRMDGWKIGSGWAYNSGVSDGKSIDEIVASTSVLKTYSAADD